MHRTETIRTGQTTITIHRPTLTDGEKENRMREIEAALKQFGRRIHKWN